MSDPDTRCDILISGGSYAGLALALALAQALDGISIAVIDPKPRGAGDPPPDDPRAFALSASSQRLLETIGIWPEIADAAQAVHEIEITDSSLDAGVRPTLLTYSNEIEDGSAASFIVPGGPLLAALDRQARATDGIRFVTGRATGYAADAHRVTISLADGSTLAGSLAVAAEGRRFLLSARRRTICPESADSAPGTVALVQFVIV